MPSYQKIGNDKLWSVRFYFTSANGVKKQKRLSGYKTKGDAEKAYIDFVNNSSKEVITISKKHAFNDLLERYFDYMRQNVKESTFVDSSSIFKLHIMPYFKDKKIEELTPLILLEWQNQFSKYSYKYKTRIRGNLYSFLRFCEKYYNIPNTMTKVDAIKNLEKKKEMQFWTETEFEKFIQCVDDITYKAFFSFLYLTGTRRGEAMALNWNDIDLKNCVVKINKTITNHTLGESTYEITAPKTANGIRTIALSNNLVILLTKLKEKQLQQENFSEEWFIFGGKQHLYIQNIFRNFKQTIIKAKVKEIRLHDLRHSHVSFLINRGKNHTATLYVIAERIGDKVEQVLKTYGHLFPNQQDTFLKELEQVKIFL